MRLASWIRFETVMTSDDWEEAISLLMSNLHRPDKELLMLLQSCVAGQQIASMEEAQVLLLKNFRVCKGNPSACAQWLTEMALDLLAPIPFREVFVILAWHLCVPKGAEMTSLRGGETFAPLPAGFRRLLWPPLPEHYQLLCLLTCMRNQLQGLCYKKGFFHGMISIATTDPL